LFFNEKIINFGYMSDNDGKYIKFICIKNCNDGQLRTSNNTIYEYEAGKLYGTKYCPKSPKQRNGVYVEDVVYNILTCGSFMGSVTSEFIDRYFLRFDEYQNNLKEINILFETMMEQ